MIQDGIVDLVFVDGCHFYECIKVFFSQKTINSSENVENLYEFVVLGRY